MSRLAAANPAPGRRSGIGLRSLLALLSLVPIAANPAPGRRSGTGLRSLLALLSLVPIAANPAPGRRSGIRLRSLLALLSLVPIAANPAPGRRSGIGLRSLLALLSLVPILLVLSGCDRAPPGGDPGGGGPGGPPGPPEVGILTVEARSAVLTTELAGRTSPYRIAEVRPQVGGIVKERKFEEGAAIQAGQTLYQIDPAPYQAAYDSAAAALARSRAVLERARLKADRHANLLKSNAVSQEDYDDAFAAMKEAAASVAVDEAALTAARIDLGYTRVTSPIDGRIGRSTVTQGALVTANQETELATIHQLDPIHVDLTQSSAQVLRLRQALADGRLQRPPGEQPRVSLLLEDGSTHAHAGRLAFSEVRVDPGTGTVTLRATFPNPDGLLLPGMFVRAIVEEGVRSAAILVPQRGVQHDRRGQPVALVLGADDRVEQRTLEVDRALGNLWLIDAGLQPGDRLILDGIQKVRPGEPARGVPFAPGAAPNQSG